MRDFWLNFAAPGVHPQDADLLPYDGDGVLNWDLNEAHQHLNFHNEADLHRHIHIGLYPQPFIGDIENATVFLLYGNPGLAISDYDDELNNPPHAALCAQNLENGGNGFFPLLTESNNTGVALYWRPRLAGIIADIANLQHISEIEASEIVRSRLCLIESGAYHSKKSPNEWIRELSSSVVAKQYVHNTLLPRAVRGEALIFVWRGAAFWEIPEDALVGVLRRPAALAQLSHFAALERQTIVNFLCP